MNDSASQNGREVVTRAATLATRPKASWWIGLPRDQFYRALHEIEEGRIRRKPTDSREVREH